MKKIISLLYAACALILVGSCDKEKLPTLDVSPAELNWEWDDIKAQTVTVTASHEWTAKVSEESRWTIIPGNDGKTFLVVPNETNETTSPVTATVTISSKNLTLTIKVTQAGAPAATIDLSSSELNWEWDDTKAQTVSVTANYEWTATISDEANWTLTTADDEKTFTVAPKKTNQTTSPVTATITINCRELTKTMKLTQAGAPETTLEISPSELNWEWDETKAQTVTITANYEWTASISDEANWTLTPANDGKTFKVAPKETNETTNPVTATITVTCKEVVKTVTCTQAGGPFVNGHEYVDLGLSVKWATCNLGANKPEEYGWYYGFGTDVYAEGYEVTWGYYFYCLGARDFTATLDYCGTDKDPLKDYVLGGSKYSRATEAGKADGIGGTKWDSASWAWMGEWRMPTIAEFNELKDKCDWTWEARNGVNGYTVKSKTNGNSIFLPAAGQLDGTELKNAGEYGNYWSSSLYASYPTLAYFLAFFSSSHGWLFNNRYVGRSVRAVTE